VNIIGIPFNGGRLERFWKGRKLLLAKAKELSANIYHIHDPELLPVALALRKMGWAVIYDAHEDLPRQLAHKHYIPNAFKAIAAWCIEGIENFYAKKCSAIVTVTPHIVQRFNRIHNQVVEVCNYPDLEDITQLKKSLSGKKMCYVGGITEARGIRELLNALELVNGELILAGHVAPSELLAELEQHPAWNKVDFRGFQNRQGVNEIYQQSDIGIVTLRPHPSYLTAYPVKMFEYMAAGLPVIATNIPLWKDILEQSNAGLCVEISNPSQYAQVINDLLASPSRAEQMGLSARKAVVDRFNWSHEAKKLLNLYENLISTKA
jgi:glycosyltransferase involved in cell wall biosynthesis